MAKPPIDALLGPRRSSIPDLVEALRGIHEARSNGPRTMPFDGPLPVGTSAVPWLLDRVARGSQDLARLVSRGPALPGSDDPAVRRYGAMRGGFERLEQDARQHAAAVDRLLNRSAHGETVGSPYQETLYLQSPRGGRTGGRFRCVNRRGQRTSVTSSLRPFTLNNEPAARAPALTLRPGSFILDPGAAEVIAVEADFSSCSALGEGTLRTSVDLHMNDAVALKIWIEIDLYEPC